MKTLEKKNDSALKSFYSTLSKLKEEFHRTGRFDDSNAKLDEITKLLTLKYYDINNQTKYLSTEHLSEVAVQKFGDRERIASALRFVFEQLAEDQAFINLDGSNIFGDTPSLNIREVDNKFAINIVSAINEIDLVAIHKEQKLDLLNETFGHFVRDNFRNHKEDAQYMTPNEVVESMVDLALKDLTVEGNKNIFSTKPNDFIVLDPTCGVGSFLTKAAEKIDAFIEQSDINNKSKIKKARNSSFYGQDKVDRMVRMSKINYIFAGLNHKNIVQGNSIVGESLLDKLANKVDLIITNPPFGAEFRLEELLEEKRKFKVLSSIEDSILAKTINSELILLDRCLTLLKPGGKMLMVVPDSVVSSSGMYEIFRQNVSKTFNLRAVIDLPPVTFAQAGTRTRCSVIYIEKKKKLTDKTPNVIMSTIKDLGYEVREKGGSPVKSYVGQNELLVLNKLYNSAPARTELKVLNENPSIVSYPFSEIINNKWNANFYDSNRINAIKELTNSGRNVEVKTLAEVAVCLTKSRKRKEVSDDTKCISVLHVQTDSTIKMDEIDRYKPKCAGVECFHGEILLSKINPRIPRIAVIPKSKFNLTCSNEFEIIQANESKYTYLLKSLLLSDVVQKQINSLTSGTSSSHNRIKTTELLNIQIPWPKKNTSLEKELLVFSEDIKKAEAKRYEVEKSAKVAANKILEALV